MKPYEEHIPVGIWIALSGLVFIIIMLITFLFSEATAKYRWKQISYVITQDIVVDGNNVTYPIAKQGWVCLDIDGIVVDNSLCEDYLK